MLFPWLLVPLITLILFALLLWGIQRPGDGKAPPPPKTKGEDSPTTEEIANTRRPLSQKAAILRRFLTSALGPDTPDLTIAYWICDRFPTIQFTSYHQCFLPLGSQLTDSLDYVEEMLFEEAPNHEIPPKSRLQTAWTFIRLPGGQEDLAIQTYFRDRHMEHQLYMMNGEGQLSHLEGEFEPDGYRLIGPRWMEYREAMVAGLAKGPAEELRSKFESLTHHDETRPDAHRWLSRLAPRLGSEKIDPRRHLAFAMELKPDYLLAKAEKANHGKSRDVDSFAEKGLNYLKEHADDVPLSGYLLCQALKTLEYPRLLRRICELLLDRGHAHGGTSRLLRELTSKNRGAQT